MRRFKPTGSKNDLTRRTLTLMKPLTTLAKSTSVPSSTASAISITQPNHPLETMPQYEEYFNQQGARTLEARMMICHISIAADKKTSMEMARYMIAVAKFKIDLDKAYNIFKEESALGNHFATLELAKLYRDGKENLVQEDNNTALAYYRLAVQQGSYLAAMSLAHSYENGFLGLAKDPEMAYKNYEEANKLVKEGDGRIADVYFNLGRCLYYSIGCSKDIKRAILLLREIGAKYKYGQAQCLLAEILEKYSLVGEVLKNEGDLKESLKWFEEAARNNIPQDQLKMGKHNKDAVQITPPGMAPGNVNAVNNNSSEKEKMAVSIANVASAGAIKFDSEAPKIAHDKMPPKPAVSLYFSMFDNPVYLEDKLDFALKILESPQSETEFKKVLEFLQDQSTVGNGFVSYRLAIAYKDGISNFLKTDKTESRKYFLRAIEQGSAGAAWDLAHLYGKSELDLIKDDKIIFELIEKACSFLKNENIAFKGGVYLKLATHLYDGIGCDKDIPRAVNLLKKSADSEHKLYMAQYMLGCCFEKYSFDGKALKNEGDLKASLEWFQKAADAGYDEAQFKVGIYCKHFPGFDMKAKSQHFFAKAAQQGHFLARKELVNCYLEGIGIRRDIKLARAILYTLTAEQVSHFQFEFMVCEMLENFEKKSYEKIEIYIAKLREVKDTSGLARNCLSEIYEMQLKGIIPVPLERFKLSAEHFSGCPHPTPYLHRKMGDLFENRPANLKPDFNKAFIYYEKASSGGDVMACYYLGLCYLVGKGVQADVKKAYIHFDQVLRVGLVEEANIGIDLCCLMQPEMFPQRKVELDNLHKLAQSGGKDVAYVLSKHYLKTDLSKSIEYFQLSRSFFDDKAYLSLLEAQHAERKNIEIARKQQLYSIKSLEDKLAQLKNKSHNELQDLQCNIQKLNLDLQMAKTNSQATSKSLVKTENKMQDESRKLKDAIDTNKQLVDQIKKQKQMIADLVASRDSIQAELDSALNKEKELISRVTKEAELAQQLNKQEESLKRLTQERDAALNENLSLKLDLEQANDKSKELLEECKVNREKETHVQESSAAQAKRETNLRLELDIAKQNEQKIKTEIEALKEAFSKKIAVISEEREKEKQKYSTDLNYYVNKSKTKNTEIRKFQSAIESLKEKLSKSQLEAEAKAKLNLELDIAKQNEQKMKTEIEALKEKLAKAELEAEKARKEAGSTTLQIATGTSPSSAPSASPVLFSQRAQPASLSVEPPTALNHYDPKKYYYYQAPGSVTEHKAPTTMGGSAGQKSVGIPLSFIVPGPRMKHYTYNLGNDGNYYLSFT